MTSSTSWLLLLGWPERIDVRGGRAAEVRLLEQTWEGAGGPAAVLLCKAGWMGWISGTSSEPLLQWYHAPLWYVTSEMWKNEMVVEEEVVVMVEVEEMVRADERQPSLFLRREGESVIAGSLAHSRTHSAPGPEILCRGTFSHIHICIRRYVSPPTTARGSRAVRAPVSRTRPPEAAASPARRPARSQNLDA